MKKTNLVDWIVLTLVLVGALNWGLVGFFEWNLVASIFGDMSTAARVVYALVGIAAVYMAIFILPKPSEE